MIRDVSGCLPGRPESCGSPGPPDGLLVRMVDDPDSAHTKALRHVTALSAGPAVPPDLRVTLNFHPDRTAGGLPLLRAMAQDGFYRSQFVTSTSTSNGGLTARPGGDSEVAGFGRAVRVAEGGPGEDGSGQPEV